MKKSRETTIISIGIDNYKQSPLINCANDAITFFNTLATNNYNLNTEKSLCISLRQNEPSISKSEILKAVDGLVENSCKDELTIFYFSGHGVQRKTNGKQIYYLVIQDDAELENSLLDFNEIKDRYRKSRAKNKLIILDTCYSGVLLKNESKADSKRFQEKIFKNTKGLYILASSTSEQTSSNTSNNNLSLFTNYLVEAFQGNPKALQDNRLTIFSLYTYLSKNVTNISRFNKDMQEPTIDAKAVHVLELADFSNSLEYKKNENNKLYGVDNIITGISKTVIEHNGLVLENERGRIEEAIIENLESEYGKTSTLTSLSYAVGRNASLVKSIIYDLAENGIIRIDRIPKTMKEYYSLMSSFENRIIDMFINDLAKSENVISERRFIRSKDEDIDCIIKTETKEYIIELRIFKSGSLSDSISAGVKKIKKIMKNKFYKETTPVLLIGQFCESEEINHKTGFDGIVKSYRFMQ